MSASLRSRSMRATAEATGRLTVDRGAEAGGLGRVRVHLDLEVVTVDRGLDLRSAVFHVLASDRHALASRDLAAHRAELRHVERPDDGFALDGDRALGHAVAIDLDDRRLGRRLVDRADRLQRAVLRRQVERLLERLRELRLLQLEPHAAARRGAQRVRGNAGRRDEHRGPRRFLPFSKRTSLSSMAGAASAAATEPDVSFHVSGRGGGGHGRGDQGHLERRALGAHAVGGLLGQADREPCHQHALLGLEGLREHTAHDPHRLRGDGVLDPGGVRVLDVDEQAFAAALDANVEHRCRGPDDLDLRRAR